MAIPSLSWLGDHHALQLHSGCVANLLVRHMVFVGNVQKSAIASHRACILLFISASGSG